MMVLCFLCLAVALLLSRRAVLAQATPSSTPRKTTTKAPDSRLDALRRWARRSGLAISPLSFAILLVLMLVAAWIGARFEGIEGAFLAAVGTLGLLLLWSRWRRSTIQRKLEAQLPSFIDQVSRRVKVGMSVQRAIEQSSDSLRAPLNQVLRRVAQRQSIGVELHECFYREYDETSAPTFQMLGSIFSINTRYGGSITDSLDSLVEMLRQQELSQRELNSITGETRITAWVMGAVPVLVTGFMLSQSPDLLLGMWNSSGGKAALVVSMLLEVTGVLLMWRMFRSL